MKADTPIVEEARARRLALSERFGHDLGGYAGHLREIEKKYRLRVVTQVTVVGTRPAADPRKP